MERLDRRVFVRNFGRCSRELVVILLHCVSVSENERDIESQCSLIQKWESKNCYCNIERKVTFLKRVLYGIPYSGNQNTSSPAP